MKWDGVYSRYGWTETVHGSDPFNTLAIQARAKRAEREAVAHVTANAGISMEYGAVKVSFSVQLECPQDEGSIHMAGELCFRKAAELTNSAAALVGLPQLQVDQ